MELFNMMCQNKTIKAIIGLVLLLSNVPLSLGDEYSASCVKTFISNAEAIERFDVQMVEDFDTFPAGEDIDKTEPTGNKRIIHIVVDYAEQYMVFAERFERPQFMHANQKAPRSDSNTGIIIGKFKDGEGIIQMFPQPLKIQKLKFEEFTAELNIPYLPIMGLNGGYGINNTSLPLDAYLDKVSHSYDYLQVQKRLGDVALLFGIPRENPEQEVTITFDTKKYVPLKNVTKVKGMDMPLGSSETKFKTVNGLSVPTSMKKDAAWKVRLDDGSFAQTESVGIVKLRWRSLNQVDMVFPDTSKLFDNIQAVIDFVEFDNDD